MAGLMWIVRALLSVQDILSIAGLVILVGGLIAAAWQVLLLNRQIRVGLSQMEQNLDWSRKEVTFAYLSKYRSELRDTHRELQRRLQLLKQDGREVAEDEFIKSLEDDGTRLELLELVSYLEQLAIGIGGRFYDEEIAFRLLSNVVISASKTLGPYLALRRRETGIEDVGAKFQELAEAWTQRVGESSSGSERKRG